MTRPAKLSRLEVVGAWLHLWTPPRGAKVPPVPWRRLILGGLLLSLVLGGAAALVVPRIDRAKDRADRRESQRLARDRAAARRERVTEQRPVQGRAKAPAGGPPGAASVRDRQALLAGVERAITANTRLRVRHGKLDRAAIRTDCRPALSSAPRRGAERIPGKRSDVYDCLAVSRDIRATRVSRGGALGTPFRAVVDFRRGTYVFCKTNPSPGEGAIPDPRRVPELPRPCRVLPR